MKKFLKITLIIILSLIILLAALLIGGYIFLKNYNIKAQKPKIVEIASKALNRSVDFSDIILTVSLVDGVRLKLKDLTISEDAHFGTLLFVRVDAIDAGLDLLAFLKFKTISIPNILVSNPTIHLIRDNQGVFNFSTIGQKTVESEKSSAPAALPALFIKSLEIENGSILMSDMSQGNPSETSVNKINLDIKQLSLTKSFPLILNAALASTEQNIHITSSVKLDLKESNLDLTDLTMSLDFNKLNWNQLRECALIPPMPLPQNIGGVIKISSQNISISDKGLSKGAVNLMWTDGILVFNNAAPGVSLEAEQINLNIENYSLTEQQPFRATLTAAVFNDQPNIDLHATVKINPAASTMTINNTEFKTDLALWNISALKENISALKDMPLPERLSGKLIATYKSLETDTTGLKPNLADASLTSGSLLIKNLTPGSILDIADTTVTIKDFSLNQPFTVSLTTGFFNDVSNISFNGTIALDTTKQITIIKNASTKINLDRLPMNQVQASGLIPAGAALPEKLKGLLIAEIQNFELSPKGLNTLLLNLEWQNGALVMTNAAPGVNVSAEAINLKAVNVSLDKPFDLEGSLAYENTLENIHFKSTIALDLPHQGIRLSNGTIEVNLALLLLDKIQSSVTALKNAPLPEELKGQLNILITEALSDAQGLKHLTAKGILKDSAIKIKEMTVPIENINLNFEITEKDLTILGIKASIGEGQISGRADVKDYATRQAFDTSIKLNKINLKDVLDQKQAPIKIEGALSGDITLAGQATDLKTINGSGTVISQQTRLKDLNVLKTILDKLAFLPNVVQRLQDGLPPQYQEKLKQVDTDIQKAEFVLKITNGNITIDPMTIEAEEFLFNGTTQAALDQSYAIKGLFKIPTTLAAVMAKEIPELQYIFDAEQNISLPVNVRGKGSNPPTFAVEEVAKDITKSVLTNVAQKQLFKLLGGSSETPTADPNSPQQTQPQQAQPQQPQPQQPQPQSQTPQEQQQPTHEEKLINDIFGSIFQ